MDAPPHETCHTLTSKKNAIIPPLFHMQRLEIVPGAFWRYMHSLVPLRLYYEIALRSFRRAATYRRAYVAGLLTNAFFAAVRCFIFIAVYRAGGTVGRFTLADALSYTWVTQSLISIGAGWVSWDLMLTIRSGDVITDLSRPWNFLGYWFSRAMGERGFNLLLRGSLTYLFGVILFGLQLPSLQATLIFIPAIILAIVISFAYSFLVNLTAFWLIDHTGVALLANTMLTFFSGFLMPLAFFPAPLAAVARVLPFQAITALPTELLLGHITSVDWLPTIALQTFWAVVMLACCVLALRAAMHKVVIQGG